MPDNMNTFEEDRGLGRLLPTSALVLVLQFILQMVVGFYLFGPYQPSTEQAYASTKAILASQPNAFIAGLHYWGSAVLIAYAFFHVCLMVLAGAYRTPRHWAWWGALVLLISALLFQITGNLLPFDRHGVQTANVEAGVAASVPAGGRAISSLILQGNEFSARTLAVWFMAHTWLISGLAIVGMLLALGRGRKQFHLWGVVPFVLVVVLALLVRAPLGDPATAADYTSYNATVSWYVWPMHGALNAFNAISPNLGWVGSAALPTLFIGFLVLLPMLSKRLGVAAVRVAFASFLVLFLVLGVAFGGRFASLTGNRDPQLLATNHSQPAQAVNAALAAQGRELFNSKSCSDCHGKDGKEASGGPNLAQVDKKYADPQWYVRFIQNPKSEHPQSTMPAFPELSEQERRAIGEYLSHPH